MHSRCDMLILRIICSTLHNETCFTQYGIGIYNDPVEQRQADGNQPKSMEQWTVMKAARTCTVACGEHHVQNR